MRRINRGAEKAEINTEEIRSQGHPKHTANMISPNCIFFYKLSYFSNNLIVDEVGAN